MNTDIRILLTYPGHPKIRRLRQQLGEAGAYGHFCLLVYAGGSRPDGILTGLSPTDIAWAADYRGNPDEFTNTLVALKLLDFDGNDYAIHDWMENNPWAAGAKARAEKARNAAYVRHHGTTPTANNQQLSSDPSATSRIEQNVSDANTLLRAETVSAKGNAPSPSPSPSPFPFQDQGKGAAVAADPPKSKRKTQFPHEHLPEDWKVYCTEKRPDLDPVRVFESCRDYHLGHGKVMLDWLRTWQRWVRETHQAPQAVNGTAHVPKQQEWKPPQTLVDELMQKFGRRPVESALAGHCVNERQFRGFVRDQAQPHWTELAKAAP